VGSGGKIEFIIEGKTASRGEEFLGGLMGWKFNN
jgi:hypothetical protein